MEIGRMSIDHRNFNQGYQVASGLFTRHQDSPVQVKHNGIPAMTLQEFYEYQAHGLNTTVSIPERLDGLFSPQNGEIQMRYDVDLYSIPTENGFDELDTQAQSVLSEYYDHAQTSLLLGHQGLFNGHRWSHIMTVANTTDSLLSSFGRDMKERVLARIATFGHDLGNITSRKYHHLLSPEMYRTILPGLASEGHEEDWWTIHNAIVAHNEEYYTHFGFAQAEFEDKVAFLIDSGIASPINSAITIADKTHIDPDRLEAGAMDRHIFDIHPHSTVTTYNKTTGLEVSTDGTEVSWTVSHNPYVPAEEAERYGNLIDKDRYTLDSSGNKLFYCYAPKTLRSDEEDGFSGADFDKSFSHLVEMYGPQFETGSDESLKPISRIGVTAMHAFGLDPRVERFVFKYVDPNGVRAPREYIFTKGNGDQVLKQMARDAASEKRDN